jgi:Protein of unknown function (DUF3443)
MRSDKTHVASAAGAIVLLSFFTACGGSGSNSNSSQGSGSSSGGSSGSTNTQALVVNSGPDNNYANGVFTTVTVCAPGTTNCTNVGGILVDTGSFGFRVLSSAIQALDPSLPQQTSAGGSTVECAQFVSNVLWGPVKTADITMAGHTASSVPIQVIDQSVAPIPSACQAIGPAEEDLTHLGANGILGIGFFISDCGTACAQTGSGNPGFYYSCTGSSCTISAESTTQQVSNPVALFPSDNNGLVVEMQAVSGNAASSSGSLIFGINTQANNALGSAQIFAPDINGNLKTVYKGTTYEGFLDSGSNGYFFLDSKATGMPDCSSPDTGFYCPSSPVMFSATNNSGTGAAATSKVNFTIGNADQLFTNNADFVFPTLGGSNANMFDWGLPFFFGRNVFVAFENTGIGPYWAY